MTGLAFENQLGELLQQHGYFGFIEPTRRDRTLEAVRPFTRSRNLLVVTTASSKRRKYRLFTARAFDDFYDYVEADPDAGREVMLIAIDDILESTVGRAFPFSATIWKRGE